MSTGGFFRAAAYAPDAPAIVAGHTDGQRSPCCYSSASVPCGAEREDGRLKGGRGAWDPLGPFGGRELWVLCAGLGGAATFLCLFFWSDVMFQFGSHDE